MKKKIKNEDVTMLIIFGVCIGVQLGMFILGFSVVIYLGIIYIDKEK